MTPGHFRRQLFLLWFVLPLCLVSYRLLLDGPAPLRLHQGLLHLLLFNLIASLILVLPLLVRFWRGIGDELVRPCPAWPLPSPVPLIWSLAALGAWLFFGNLHRGRLTRLLPVERLFLLTALAAFCLQAAIHGRTPGNLLKPCAS